MNAWASRIYKYLYRIYVITELMHTHLNEVKNFKYIIIFKYRLDFFSPVLMENNVLKSKNIRTSSNSYEKQIIFFKNQTLVTYQQNIVVSLQSEFTWEKSPPESRATPIATGPRKPRPHCPLAQFSPQNERESSRFKSHPKKFPQC